MPRLRTLEVIFDFEIAPYEVPAFRSAVIELVGREHVAFHNHVGDNGYHFRYPVIQYKRNRRNASIFCLDEGIEELYSLFNRKGNAINIGEQRYNLHLKHIAISQPFIQVWDKTFHYRLRNWLPLSQKNYQLYKEAQGLAERVAILERVLKGNILAFAKGINWRLDKELEVTIDDILAEKAITYKKIRMLAFDVNFTSNAYLPNQLGLGKGVSKGFGVLRHVRKKEEL